MNSSSGTTPNCTLGFVWRRNSTGERMGGTANHCGNSSSWYSTGTFVGSMWSYHPGTDSMMLRSSPTSGFNPNMWVGPYNSTLARLLVKGTYVSAVNCAVALSASRSGQHVTTVRSVGTLAVLNGTTVYLTVMNSSSCKAGDSGAPWFSTRSSDGQALAHGQHVGLYSGAYCAYVPVAAIGTAHGFTIATG